MVGGTGKRNSPGPCSQGLQPSRRDEMTALKRKHTTYLQNNTDHSAVMGVVRILPGRQSGHSRMWQLSTCSEAGATEELALKMEQPLLDSAGLECIGGRGDTRPGIVTRVPFSISCSSSSSSLGKAVLTSPEDPTWSDCCGPASLFSWLSVSLLLGKRHSLSRLCLVSFREDVCAAREPAD
ncbi:PREDICTED: uncharacterized protein LOC106724435 isoform X2 [Myotis brandtii]|uniref:uncharacterized protein LOC106724435 isoform X2 n=1 Tax=Myotis brandtii TaxID=109478 RepID=UPI000703D7FA|nr:PREDICTED: uncharacterized protein LOC106724435 isoform X2 [Myotis brandtii]